LNPWLSIGFDIPLAVVFVTTIFSLIFIQELGVIQIVYREDNVEFTRRFLERYPQSGLTRFARYSPHGLSAILLLSLWISIGEMPNVQGWYITCLLFYIFVRIFDPLLGCIMRGTIPWLSILGYIVIYVFVVSSAVDPGKMEFIPVEFTQAATIAILSVVILQLRMAYYENFCFERDHRLEGQLKFVLGSLIFISLPRLFSAVQEMSGYLNG
jgi:hypothetical protein